MSFKNSECTVILCSYKTGRRMKIACGYHQIACNADPILGEIYCVIRILKINSGIRRNLEMKSSKNYPPPRQGVKKLAKIKSR
jgi:hypothetical protein